MAKSFHLKEIIDFEINNPGFNQRGTKNQKQFARPSSRRKFPAESLIWQTVLQTETLGQSCFD